MALCSMPMPPCRAPWRACSGLSPRRRKSPSFWWIQSLWGPSPGACGWWARRPSMRWGCALPVALQSTAPAEALPLRRLLVANRGEIAVRLLRACRVLGLATVAVYTEPARQALHVQLADEAYSVGEDPLAGYLDIEGLLAVARASGCDSLHPGYGFLAENPELAAACQREGLVFVGPGAEVIRRMGDKTAARQAMLAAGVPVTPGSDPVADLAEACREAARLGYPVMLKAGRSEERRVGQ